MKLTTVESVRKKEKLKECLQKCKIFHLAGHFSINYYDPLHSHLFLDDEDANPLSVADLLDIKDDLVPCPGYTTSSSSSLPNKLTPSGSGGGKPLPLPTEYGDPITNRVECFNDIDIPRWTIERHLTNTATTSKTWGPYRQAAPGRAHTGVNCGGLSL